MKIRKVYAPGTAIARCSMEKLFLKHSQILQEKTYAGFADEHQRLRTPAGGS